MNCISTCAKEEQIALPQSLSSSPWLSRIIALLQLEAEAFRSHPRPALEEEEWRAFLAR
jgi:hypothetical protein